MRIHYFFLMTTLALSGLVFAGCGDDDDDDDDDVTGDAAVDGRAGDTGTGGDASGDASASAEYHDCADADFMDGDMIMFGGSVGNAYSPKCLDVSVGDMVTFMGDGTATFVNHPLRGGVAPSREAMDPDAPATNPIADTSAGASVQFTFNAVGSYPFYCNTHQGSGMYGVVRVTE